MSLAVAIMLMAFLGILKFSTTRQGSSVGSVEMRAIEADIAVVLQRVRAGGATQDATTYLSAAGFECLDITAVLDPDPERVGRVIVCRKPYRKLLSLFPQELAIEITTSEDGASITKLRHYRFKYQA